MSDKTVIKELFEFIRLSHPDIDEDVNEEFWEDKFRNQIMDAFVAGDERGTGEIPFNYEQYFNLKYKK
jgi:hypothetical protein